MLQPRRLLFALMTMLVPGLALAARGGPDGFGYTWLDLDEPGIDNARPTFTPTDIRALGFRGDDAVYQITLPKAFPYYGSNYTSLWLSSNGWLSFTDPVGNSYPTSATIPGTTPPNNLVAFFWDDWTLDAAAPGAYAGPTTQGDGYHIIVTLADKADPTRYLTVHLTLYYSGVIKVNYFDGDPGIKTARTNAGIENTGGTTGVSYLTNGTPQGGSMLRNGMVVEYFPPIRLNCAGVAALSCPQPPTVFDNLAGANNVSRYGCNPGVWDGNEKVFSLTLTRRSNVTVLLSNTGGRNMTAFLMGACNEYLGCIIGGSTALQRRFLTPGTYYIVVDAATAADNGTFTLEVQCGPAAKQVTCGTVLTSEATFGADTINAWSCQTGLNGPEQFYELNLGGQATLRATLSNESDPNLWVVLSDYASFNPFLPDCEIANNSSAALYGPPIGDYLVSVDGTSGASGSYDIKFECTKKLVCPSPANVIDVTNPAPINGNTAGKTNNVDAYFCAESAYNLPGEEIGYTGPEDVYEFTLASPGMVSFAFSAPSPDMRLLLLRDCYEGTCIYEGGCSENLAAGTYRLVVDGVNGASGPYSIAPTLSPIPTYTHWWDCPECVGGCPGGQSPAVIGLRNWHFNSMNYCGTGCNFSLFAVVECGTEFHIPFFDVETGHLQAFDLFRNRFVDLKATNDVPANMPGVPGGLDLACLYTDTGTAVQWEDVGCSMIPCPPANCGGGTDCRTNMVIMDVSFDNPISVCGVYRLDFNNWGGFDWFVFANCTADNVPQYFIYRDLCAALANNHPLPQLGIDSIGVDNSECGTLKAKGSIRIENIGCSIAANVEITVDQKAPAASHPKTFTVTLAPGELGTFPWDFNIDASPMDLVFSVDPNNTTLECSENLGATVSCGTLTELQRTFDTQACGACVNMTPPSVGNTFKLVKDTAARQDILFSWAPIVGTQLSVYRIFEDAAKAVPPASRIKNQDVSASLTTARDANGVPAIPAVNFYQIIGVSCLGDLEGPY